MRRILLFKLLVLLLIAGLSAVGQQKEQLMGAWELVSADYGKGNRPLSNKEVKFISRSHFVWVRYDKDGNTRGEGGGAYTFSGTVMVEHLEYIDKQEDFLKGKDQTMTITFQGEEIFTSSGTLTNGQQITEVWKRLD